MKKELRAIFELHEGDRRSAWEMGPDGAYLQRMPAGEQNAHGSHQLLIANAENRSRAVLKPKKIKTG